MTKIKNDLLDPEVIKDPHSYFRQLRNEDPVHWNERWKGWIITKYSDCQTLMQDPRISANRLNERVLNKMNDEGRYVAEVMKNWMVLNDPPDHTRIRRVLQKAFSPRAVEAMREATQNIVNQAIEEIVDKDKVDIVSEFAFSVPSNVLSVMLGLPKEDFDKVKQWTHDLNTLVFIDLSEGDRHKKAYLAVKEMSNYFEDKFKERRANPGNDLLTALIDANEDGILTDEELIAQCILLFQGGHETTTALISSAILHLLKNPDQMQKLKENPSLINNAVEEFIRFDGPAKGNVRLALEDIEIRDKVIKKGDRMIISNASANRDEDIFENPDIFDITRNPNPHLGFGHGSHYCLGNQLARLEARIAINSFVQRIEEVKLADRELNYHPTAVARLLKSLNIEIGN
ncbi:cytochrome P450 [Bacillus sp. FJAT-29814]|uniref:cytochrome P450 n=1 Tax=Bacillus sp. FJAT-29814 TaxID=1729688 RepID=UPI00082FE6BD|nr:cytochrome P450 [Bacillus sp. FJAT-29814]